MKTRIDVAVTLLDLAAGDAPETARSAARARLADLCRAESAALVARVGRVTVNADVDDRDVWPEERNGAASVAARVAALGRPRISTHTPDPAVTRASRALLDVDADRFDSVLGDLGLAEAAFLCRDLDTGSARRLAARLRGAAEALGEFVPLAPGCDPDLLRGCCRRLAAHSATDLAGLRLARAMGRSLAQALASSARADVGAALLRRLAAEPVAPTAEAGVWAVVVQKVMARRTSQ
jgi:hypothetical protein